MEVTDITAGQLLMLAGVGVILLVILFALKFILKMTSGFLKLGCLAILVILLIAFVVLLALPAA